MERISRENYLSILKNFKDQQIIKDHRNKKMWEINIT